jgi:hypothetical protein
LHNREVGRLFAFDDATGIDTDLAISIREGCSMAIAISSAKPMPTKPPVANLSRAAVP